MMGGMGGGMMAGSQPANLMQASPDALVSSLPHCGDSYVVRTASGKTHKV